jgi:hypothetical protein
MNRRVIRMGCCAVFLIWLACLPVWCEGLRSLGLRLSLSWGATPVWLGIEASTDLPWAILSGSLFLTADGKTLFTAHVDVPLQEDSSTFLRATAGLYYFQSTQLLPYPLVGAGVSYQLVLASPFYVGFAGEFIYPLAFPLPMFSISGGWQP